jgi:hypothetical protein
MLLLSSIQYWLDYPFKYLVFYNTAENKVWLKYSTTVALPTCRFFPAIGGFSLVLPMDYQSAKSNFPSVYFAQR